MPRLFFTLLLCIALSANAASEAEQLTTLVQAAVVDRDYDRAERLAVTAQHRLIIAQGHAADKQANEEKKAEWRKQLRGNGRTTRCNTDYSYSGGSSTTTCY